MADFGDSSGKRQDVTEGLDLFATAAPAVDVQVGCKPPAAPLPLAPEVGRLIAVLRDAKGKDRAVTSRVVAEILGIAGQGNDRGRKAREIVQLHFVELGMELVQETGLVLVADTGVGYYLTDNPEAIRHYLATISSRTGCLVDRGIGAATVAAAAGIPGASDYCHALEKVRRHLDSVRPPETSAASLDS